MTFAILVYSGYNSSEHLGKLHLTVPNFISKIKVAVDRKMVEVSRY